MDGDATPGVSTGSYLLLALGSASYFLFLFVWFLLPAFLNPIIADVGLSSTQAGIVAGAIQLIYIPFAIASGLLVDRVGARNAIAAGLALLGAAGALRANAAGFTSLLLPTLLLGVGGTGITFGLPKLVSELFPPERTGSMSSVYVVGSSLGTAAAFGVGRPVLGPLAGGWRPVFLWTGIGVVGFAALWFVVSTLLFRRVHRFSGSSAGGAFSVASIREDVAAVVTHPQLRLLVIVGTMHLFLSHGLQAWLQTALEVRGMAVGVAATVTSLLIVARITGTITIPALSDRLGARRGVVVGCGLLGAVGTVGVLLSGAGVVATAAAVVIVGVGIGGLAPLIRAIPIELDGIGPRLTATANGLIFAVGEVGGFSGPFLVGWTQDLTGSFVAGLAVLAAGALVIAVVGYAMAEPAG